MRVICNSGTRNRTVATDPESYEPHNVWLAVVPFYHMYGSFIFCTLAPQCGITTIVLPSFKLATYLEMVEKYKVTVSIIG